MRVAYLHPYEIHRKSGETLEEYNERLFADAVEEDEPMRQGELI